MINSSVLGFYEVKRKISCYSCNVSMIKGEKYLKIELSTNRRNYCLKCFDEWFNLEKSALNE